MFPKEDKNPQRAVSNRGVVMAAYTFEQDATILGSLPSAQRIAIAARNLATILPQADSLSKLEAYASQVFPADEMAGGSAFCYFGPMQKTDFLETMIESDWEKQVFFAGEHGMDWGSDFECEFRARRIRVRGYFAHKSFLMGVHLMGMHLVGVHLVSVHLVGVHLVGVHLVGRIS
jgi:Flavin containing amine oxidoreductase